MGIANDTMFTYNQSINKSIIYLFIQSINQSVNESFIRSVVLEGPWIACISFIAFTCACMYYEPVRRN